MTLLLPPRRDAHHSSLPRRVFAWVNGRAWLLLGLAGLLLGSQTLCFGQGATGLIRGSVVDPQGGVILQATVTAVNIATGVARSTQTTDAGIYIIPDLPPGDYEVRVEKSGFSRTVAKVDSIGLVVRICTQCSAGKS